MAETTELTPTITKPTKPAAFTIPRNDCNAGSLTHHCPLYHFLLAAGLTPVHNHDYRAFALIYNPDGTVLCSYRYADQLLGQTEPPERQTDRPSIQVYHIWDGHGSHKKYPDLEYTERLIKERPEREQGIIDLFAKHGVTVTFTGEYPS